MFDFACFSAKIIIVLDGRESLFFYHDLLSHPLNLIWNLYEVKNRNTKLLLHVCNSGGPADCSANTILMGLEVVSLDIREKCKSIPR